MLNQSRMLRKDVFFVGIQTMIPHDFSPNHFNRGFTAITTKHFSCSKLTHLGKPISCEGNFTQNWQRLVDKGLAYPLHIVWKFIHSGFKLLIIVEVEVVALKLVKLVF